MGRDLEKKEKKTNQGVGVGDDEEYFRKEKIFHKRKEEEKGRGAVKQN